MVAWARNIVYAKNCDDKILRTQILRDILKDFEVIFDNSKLQAEALSAERKEREKEVNPGHGEYCSCKYCRNNKPVPIGILAKVRDWFWSP